MAFEAHMIQRRLVPPEYQDPEVLNQANPVQNTWYDILDETNCIVIDVAVNVEDANETLEVRIVVDGVTLPSNDLACTPSTSYFVTLKPDAINRINEVTLVGGAEKNDNYNGFLIMGRDVQISVRKTTALGAGNLTAVASWGKYSATDV